MSIYPAPGVNGPGLIASLRAEVERLERRDTAARGNIEMLESHKRLLINDLERERGLRQEAQRTVAAVRAVFWSLWGVLVTAGFLASVRDARQGDRVSLLIAGVIGCSVAARLTSAVVATARRRRARPKGRQIYQEIYREPRPGAGGQVQPYRSVAPRPNPGAPDTPPPQDAP